ncbi:MAG TPA: ATP synthase F1 subunit delta [Pyrinomonadaceae bacterium]|nr:ATP synthase F1 subunit delta [Pyrinomonadaceae bacterium]
MANETIARRYASALADVVLKTGEAENIKTELAVWAQLFVANSDLQNVLGNPAIAHQGKERVLGELLNKMKPSKTTSNFLRVLLQNHRLGDIAEISERFAAVLAERGGIVNAEVISARELPQDEKTEFERTLEKLTGKDMQITFTVDPSLIGGAVTRIGSTVYDGSVRTKLDTLKQQLAGVN